MWITVTRVVFTSVTMNNIVTMNTQVRMINFLQGRSVACKEGLERCIQNSKIQTLHMAWQKLNPVCAFITSQREKVSIRSCSSTASPRCGGVASCHPTLG